MLGEYCSLAAHWEDIVLMGFDLLSHQIASLYESQEESIMLYDRAIPS